MIELCEGPIDPARVLDAVTVPAAGGVVLFLGTVRDWSEGSAVVGLDYDAHRPLALSKLREIADSARSRWPVERVAVVHRLGSLELMDAAVAVAVSSRHRSEAFLAAQWIMDTIKQAVPIWKRERWAEADRPPTWVHPSLPANPSSSTEPG